MAIDDTTTDPSRPSSLPLLQHFHQIKTSLSAFLYRIPTSIRIFLLLVLLVYSGASNLSIHIPFPTQIPPESECLLPVNAVERATRNWSSSSSSSSLSSSLIMNVVKEEIPSSKLKTHLPLRQKLESSVLPLKSSTSHRPRGLKRKRSQLKILQSTTRSMQFSRRLKEFFNGSYSLNSSASPCKIRFFMTWISSSLESFGHRELFSIESLFKSHPNACLLILSDSMDSRTGARLLRPFLEQGFRVTAIPPYFDYIFKNTPAEDWFNRLRKGNVDPGDVSLGQNLSNLLRLAVLYKFGGVYIDTDVIILKSFSNLRNVIGAQTLDLEGNWSRLNNAVLIFDRKHPLLLEFIEEFALTFDGNKWGHNGPYLVSRVVSRVTGQPSFNFTVLPPPAFYPVGWSRVHDLFQSPGDGVYSKWLSAKLRYIRRQSIAVHLWNRLSRKLKVEEGSIIGHIMLDCCIFCNTTMSAS